MATNAIQRAHATFVHGSNCDNVMRAIELSIPLALLPDIQLSKLSRTIGSMPNEFTWFFRREALARTCHIVAT